MFLVHLAVALTEFKRYLSFYTVAIHSRVLRTSCILFLPALSAERGRHVSLHHACTRRHAVASTQVAIAVCGSCGHFFHQDATGIRQPTHPPNSRPCICQGEPLV